MTENSRQPRPDDAVLGGQNYQQINAAVLGGMEGVKQLLKSIEGVKLYLKSGDVEQKIAALPENLKYGQAGLEMLIQALRDQSWGVRSTAYSLLQENAELALKEGLRVYDLHRLKCFHTISASNEIKSVAFSPDSRTLASSSGDRTIKLWDVETGELKTTLTEHSKYSIYLVFFSPDGRTLASGGGDKTIKLWDVETSELKTTLTEHSISINSVAFSPDGRILASGGCESIIKLWDVETGELKITLTGHSSWIKSVAFSPDGQTLASSSGDDTIKLWDVETGELKITLTGHSGVIYSVVFSPDGQTLASSSGDGTIKLWDVETGRHKTTLIGHSGVIYSVVFSPDGQTLASGNGDKTIKLWNVETGRLKTTLTGHSGFIYSVAFSPDGRTLASGNSDGIIKLWKQENSTQFEREPIEFFHRYLVLKEALKKSGETGLELLIQSLNDESLAVRNAVCWLLHESEEPEVKQALQEYCTRLEREPIEFFHRYLVLKAALKKSGETGLELLRQSLKDKSLAIRQAAYWLLQESEEPKVKQALQEYCTSLSSNNIIDECSLLNVLLAQCKWQDAEAVTENILLIISGCKRGASIATILNKRTGDYDFLNLPASLKSNIPTDVLKTILQLWQNHGNVSPSFQKHKALLGFWLELEQQIGHFFKEDELLKRVSEDRMNDPHLGRDIYDHD